MTTAGRGRLQLPADFSKPRESYNNVAARLSASGIAGEDKVVLCSRYCNLSATLVVLYSAC